MTTQGGIIDGALAADIPVLLWGAPGTGKTAAIQALARERGARVETLIGSTLDPVDVAGQPIPSADGHVVVAPPSWARRIRAALDAGTPAWLFLDELSCTPPAVQAALLRIVHERRVAEIDLSGCRVIAAANRADHAADGGLLSAAMSSRWMHVDWLVDADAWVSGELRGWGQQRPAAQAAAAAKIAAFIQKHQSALLKPPTPEQDHSQPWPCPRSWSAAARLLAALGQCADSAAISGLVGPAAASEYATWASAQDLCDPEEVLAGRATLPDRGDQRMVALLSVAAAALCEHARRPERIRAAWGVLGKIRRDVSVPAARALAAGAPEIVTPELEALGEALRDCGARS